MNRSSVRAMRGSRSRTRSMYSTWKIAFDSAWAGPSWISWASRDRSASCASTIRISTSNGRSGSSSLGDQARVAALEEQPAALEAAMGELEPGELRLVRRRRRARVARRPSGGVRSRASSAPASAASTALGPRSPRRLGGDPRPRRGRRSRPPARRGAPGSGPSPRGTPPVLGRSTASRLFAEYDRAALASAWSSSKRPSRASPTRVPSMSPEYRGPAIRAADLEDARLRQGASVGRLGRRRSEVELVEAGRAGRVARQDRRPRAVLVVAHDRGSGSRGTRPRGRRRCSAARRAGPASASGAPRRARSGSRLRSVRPPASSGRPIAAIRSASSS